MLYGSKLVNKDFVENRKRRLFVLYFTGNDWNLAAVSLNRRGQQYNHAGTLNVPGIVS